ncbi:MAG: hypothetical protein EOP09_18495 [Proteobacteria bacterium]|nr:MAG: hypothetical protein EOP09_18495 [Pseudomonadota bacterium]
MIDRAFRRVDDAERRHDGLFALGLDFADLDLSTFNRLRDKAELEKSKPGSVRAVPMGETNSAGNLEQSK